MRALRHDFCTFVMGTITMLDKELKYYLDNKDRLIAEYNGKYIVIVGNDVVGSYNDEDAAYVESVEKYGLGNFLIQFCDKNNESQVQTFHSRVSFA